MHHLTRTFFNTLAFTSICAAAAAMLPADALACGPPASGLTSHTPTDGAYYPANGIILFEGYDISLDQVTVTIDGSPASLVDASAAFSTKVATLAARVNPKPNADQKVTISGSFCMGCPSESFGFTARVDDLIAPEGVVSAEYGVHDYADFKSGGGDCQSDSDLGLWVRAQTTPAPEEEAPAILLIEAFADSALSKPIGSRASVISSSESVWGFRPTMASLQGADPTNVCFRLSTKDLSGNNGPEPTILCNACYRRTDAQGSGTGSPPGQPAWGEADTIAGGPCDYSAGVGGPKEDSATCSYRAEGSSSASTSWFFVACAALGLRAARKRSRNATK